MRVYFFLVIFIIAGCQVKLSEVSSDPNFPIDGVWIQKMEDQGHIRLLSIESGENENFPYNIKMIEIFPKTLSFSGRRIYITQTEGYADASKNEVMLVQQKFLAGRYHVKQDSGKVWPVTSFGRWHIEREFEKAENIDLLEFDSDGNELLGSEFKFKRALISNKPGTFALTGDIGYVLQSDKENKTLLIYSFSPVISIVNKNRTLISPSNKRQKIKIKQVYRNFINAEFKGSEVELGSVVVMPGFKTGKKYKKRMSKREVLQRLKQGLHVPKEDLIRALGSNKKKSNR